MLYAWTMLTGSNRGVSLNKDHRQVMKLNRLIYPEENRHQRCNQKLRYLVDEVLSWSSKRGFYVRFQGYHLKETKNEL